jgi:hypothetical protein
MKDKSQAHGRDEKGHYTKGNNFWEIRSSNTRGQIFESPEKMWESACGYFQYITDHPHHKAEQNRQAGKPVMGQDGKLGYIPSLLPIPVMRPFTKEGLSLYLHVNTHYFNEFSDRLEKKKEPEVWETLTKEEREIVIGFSEVIRMIRETIDNNQFDGAASGFFNPNIIARKLGLGDKIEQKVSGEITNITGMIIK